MKELGHGISWLQESAIIPMVFCKIILIKQGLNAYLISRSSYPFHE